MRKGEAPEETFISPKTSVQVYIDEDDVGMFRLCKIESGAQRCSLPLVVSIGPVTEIVCEPLDSYDCFVVAYAKPDGTACARQGVYEDADEAVWWSEEVQEEPCCEMGLWALRN